MFIGRRLLFILPIAVLAALNPAAAETVQVIRDPYSGASYTGHAEPDDPNPLDFAALARMETIALYMGVRNLGENCRRRARDLADNAPLDKACVLIEGDSGRNIMYDF